jgi:hypothetical protein
MSMRHVKPSHRQPDLFAVPAPPTTILAVELARLTPLISTLLTEVVSLPATKEDNDEDHA